MGYALGAHPGMEKDLAASADEAGPGGNGAPVIAVGRTADGEIG